MLYFDVAKVIFTNGCFDVIHRGHISLLEYCSSLGEVVVGLNSDESVRRLKGDLRPYNKVEDRKAILEAIKFVSQVHVFHEDTPYELIKKVNPEIIVKGGDYSVEQVVGKDICEVRIFNTVVGYSSTKLLQDIFVEI